MSEGKMIPLYKKCPELGDKMLGFSLKDEEGYPDGDYVLMELFCDNPDCDCRNVYIYIMTASPEIKTIARINYGWESREFYEKIFPSEDEAARANGIYLLDGKQSELSDAFLKLFRKLVREANFGEKIRKHYKLFKAALRKEKERGRKILTGNKGIKIGRNDPCPCGSGKKLVSLSRHSTNCRQTACHSDKSCLARRTLSRSISLNKRVCFLPIHIV